MDRSTPARTERAAEVAKVLLREIMPRCGFPGPLQSDHGPAFVSQVTKGIISALDVKLDLELSLETPIVGASKEIQSGLEMGLNRAMPGKSRKFN